ncbi:hypothetical protein PLICRDRAFT_202168 [Plicaturopsis crispa FD-325 SS-3]|nr:hypothetical protein PLICRDRAFT_202168 [Plicaturopsis crispa FD-325 SS-3]
MAPRRRCPLCQSKQWHKEPSSGLVVCSEGHVLQDYRNENLERDEAGPHAMRKRTIKSQRKKKEKLSKGDPKLYHGARSRYHVFQCLQLILRKQIVALTRLWDLPPEFEIVCRDTWALHLSLLPNPPPAEPYFHQKESGGDSRSPEKDSAPHMTQTKFSTPERAENPAENEKDGSSSSNSSSSSSSSSEDEDEEDPEFARLLQENSDSGTSSDEGAPGDSKPIPPVGRSKKKGRRSEYESPASNLAVLMFSSWTMRIPVTYMDFQRIIESYELPYLDPVRLLPATMTCHLTKHAIQLLSPYHAPSTLFLHALTSRLSKRIYASYGIYTPELNAAPILWRTVQYMGGTPTLYDLTKRLGSTLSLPLTLHNSMAPMLEQLQKRDPESHKYDNVPPELAIVATVIIVLKMALGLDGRPRAPHDPNDPAFALPRLDDYLRLVRAMDDIDAGMQDSLFSAKTPMSVGDLTDDLLDKYLDFCDQALLGPDDRSEKQHHVLANHFPLQNSDDRHARPPPDVQTNVGYSRVSRNVTGPASREEIGGDAILPGEAYIIYNSRDVSGTLPEEYERVLSRGARCVGVSNEYLAGVVQKYEHRVLRWWKGEKRKSRENR